MKSNGSIPPAQRPELPKLEWENAVVLLTGGTGSFGRKFTRLMLDKYHPRKLIIFSRDELKQHEMRTSGFDHPSLRYFIGDVRDGDRLRRSMKGVDVVVHAAALKQVPACEYNPIEAVLTNVMGARNVIDAALDTEVERVLAISTDKAVGPVNLYGATKLVAEKLFVQANAYSGSGPTRFSCVRYGNVVGSRGSVIPLFRDQAKTGRVTVTDPRMTRFWLTLDQGVQFVVRSTEAMHGGEVFIPKIPSMNILDLVAALAPECDIVNTGIRPGEKLHEALISEDESAQAVETDGMFIIKPAHPWWRGDNWTVAKPVADGFSYVSNTNPERLSVEDLRKILKETAA
jgi:UDP-N-acetylglucosamine 4,6-dehydratase